jgi:hypothetical protein
MCSAVAEPSSSTQPNAGAVEGARYSSAFFNFSYYIPEQWAVRTVASRAPGTGFPLLLSLKKKSGTDALSVIMITATELPPTYNGDVARYLTDRYRLSQAESQTSINGIPTSRMKRSNAAPSAELLSIGDRNYYRIESRTPSVSRVAIATMEKNYAIVFELIVPTKDIEPAAMELTDSLHGLNFAVKNQKK